MSTHLYVLHNTDASTMKSGLEEKNTDKEENNLIMACTSCFQHLNKCLNCKPKCESISVRAWRIFLNLFSLDIKLWAKPQKCHSRDFFPPEIIDPSIPKYIVCFVLINEKISCRSNLLIPLIISVNPSPFPSPVYVSVSACMCVYSLLHFDYPLAAFFIIMLHTTSNPLAYSEE